MICLDSSFIIDFLRGKPEAVKKIEEIESENLITTEINVYEILVGLFTSEYHKRLAGEKQQFEELMERLSVFTLDRRAVEKSARIMSLLRIKGEGIEPPDVLIAGIMLANDCTRIVTRNQEHFKRIKELKVELY